MDKRPRTKSDNGIKSSERSQPFDKKDQTKDDMVQVIGSKTTNSNDSLSFKFKRLFDARSRRSRAQQCGSFVLDISDDESADQIVYSLGHRAIHRRFSEFFALHRRLRRRFTANDLRG